jgi:radical SAM superfamily enzyme with C-terminal helix-hairpin-helix motif
VAEDAAAEVDADGAEVLAVAADVEKAMAPAVLAPTRASTAIRKGIGRVNVPSRAVMEQSAVAGEEIVVDAAAETVEEAVAAVTKLGSKEDMKGVPSLLSVRKMQLCFCLTASLRWNRARRSSTIQRSALSFLSHVRVLIWEQMMKRWLAAGTLIQAQHTT